MISSISFKPSICVKTLTLEHNSLLHLFGFGSPLSIKLGYYIGARSFDSRSWTINAWFRLIFIEPGVRKRVDDLINVKGPNHRLTISKFTLKELYENRKLRAIHNVVFLLHEIDKLKNMSKDEIREEIMMSRFHKRVLEEYENAYSCEQ